MGLFSKSDKGNGGVTQVDCGDILDISRVGEFHSQLTAALGKGGEIVIDAAELGRIDAAALQLLTAFFQDAAARKVTAKWNTPSDALIRSAGLLGLSTELGLPDRN